MNFLEAAHSFRPFSHPKSIGGWCMLGPTVIVHSDNVASFYDDKWKKDAVEAELHWQAGKPFHKPRHIHGVDAVMLLSNEWFICANTYGWDSKPEAESPSPHGLGAVVHFNHSVESATGRDYYVYAVKHNSHFPQHVSYHLVGMDHDADTKNIRLNVDHSFVGLVKEATQELFEKMVKLLVSGIMEE